MCINICKYKYIYIYIYIFADLCGMYIIKNFTTYTVPYYYKETEKDTEFL
jgi:hypothetical protein